MNNINNKSKENLIKFAITELKKTIETIKQGNQPTGSPQLKKMFQMIKESYEMAEQKKISENDIDIVIDEISKNIDKKEK